MLKELKRHFNLDNVKILTQQSGNFYAITITKNKSIITITHAKINDNNIIEINIVVNNEIILAEKNNYGDDYFKKFLEDYSEDLKEQFDEKN